MYDYPSIRDWIEDEWHYHALVIGIDDSVFWHLTPKTIQVYFKAYKKRRQTEVQDLWLQGKYFACAIASTISFSKSRPPEYPEMPYQDEMEEELANDEEWLDKQRAMVWQHFTTLLGGMKKDK